MKNFKKLAALIMAAVLLATAFAGCGKTEKPSSDMPEFIYVPTYTKITLPEGISWLGSVQYIGGRFYAVADSQVEGKTITDEATGESYTETKYVQKLLSFDENGGDFKEIAAIGMDNYWDEKGGYSEYINNVIETSEGLAVTISRNTVSYDAPEGITSEDPSFWEYENSTLELVFAKINEDGTLGEETVFYTRNNKNNAQDVEEEFYPNYYVLGENGNFYVGSWNAIRVYGADSKEIYRIENLDESGVNGLVKLKDGSVGCLTWEENGMNVAVIDDAKKALGEKYALPENVYSVSSGGGVYDFIYGTGSGNGIGFYDIEKGEGEKLLDWLDSDVDSSSVYAERVFVKDEENLIAFEETWNEEGTVYNLIALKKTPSSEVKEKKIITLASIFTDYELRQKVLEFNKTNPEYRIRITDYSEYASGEDMYGLTKLNTEIISGNIPDIFITNNMPMDRFAGKGVFEDLVPYIERDIGWDNLVEPVFRALMNEEGKLYEIHDSFSVMTYVGLKNVVGDGSRWTFEDLKEAYAKLPEGASVFGEDITKAGAFSLLFSNNVNRFVDWEKGECYFNDQEFIDILKFTENFPLEFTYDDNYYEYYEQPVVKVVKGKQLMAIASLYSLQEARSSFYILGDNVSFVGLPTNEGTGNSFMLNSGFAMSATSEHKEVVWEFISSILSEESQSKEHYYNLPTNKAVFDKMVEKEMTPEFDEFYQPEGVMTPEVGIEMPAVGYDGDVALPAPNPGKENPEEPEFTLPEYVTGQVNEQGWHEVPKTYGWVENGTSYFEFPIYAMTEQEYNVIMDLINSTTKVSRYDDSVMNIVNEEIEYFFNGERTAEQTAEYIQSRVNLYVNEQR